MSLLRIYAPLGETPSRCAWALVDARQAARMGLAWICGCEEAGAIACVKHFDPLLKILKKIFSETLQTSAAK